MNEPYHEAVFERRWFICGTLTTKGLFHLGDGTREERRLNEEKPVEVNAVFRDGEGRPCVPGSSLKGALRSRLKMVGGLSDEAIKKLSNNLFGEEDVKLKVAPAGKVQFHDARIAASHPPPPEGLNIPFLGKPRKVAGTWMLDPWTGVSNLVAIERRMRTARDKKLAHRAVVPPEVTFDLLLTADNLDEPEITWLLWALNQFDPGLPEPLRLGAETGNDWGKLCWSLKSVKRLDQQRVRHWIEESLKPGAIVTDPADTHATDVTALFEAEAMALSASLNAQRFALKVTLSFDGPFLVKDPSKGLRKGEPDAQPRLTHDGRLLLPARSFRGALRSQAERIVRTLTEPVTVPDPTGDQAEQLDWVSKKPQWHKLSLPAILFGATGWGAALEISDFIGAPVSEQDPITQEFVAIDRFTGGSAVDREGGEKAKGKKFQARFIWAPELHGTIRLHLDRLAGHPEEQTQARGLLALALRDLKEGDITFGLGASKGYGACRAEFALTDSNGSAWQPAAWQSQANACRDHLKSLAALPS